MTPYEQYLTMLKKERSEANTKLPKIFGDNDTNRYLTPLQLKNSAPPPEEETGLSINQEGNSRELSFPPDKF